MSGHFWESSGERQVSLYCRKDVPPSRATILPRETKGELCGGLGQQLGCGRVRGRDVCVQVWARARERVGVHLAARDARDARVLGSA